MPITLDGTNGITTPTYGGADTSEYLVPVTAFKNRIINGAMVIDQRNAGASVTINSPSATYTLDRWRAFGQTTDGVFTVQQSSTAPVGFINSLLVTVTTADASIGSTQFYTLQQAIEGLNVADLGFGTANAKTVTISFQVRSSVTGTFSGSLKNNDGTRSYPFTYSISVADTWETKSVTIAGDTTGTWLTTNGIGMTITFSLGSGSNRLATAGAWAAGNYDGATGATTLISTLNATFYITGVQLEVGSTATSFDYRPYGTELALCQRYYYRMNGLVNQDMLVGAAADQTTWIRYSFALPVIMRTTPSLVSTAASTYSNLTATGGQAGSAIALDNSSETNVTLNLNSGGITKGYAATFRIGSNPTGYVAFSSEL